MTKTIEKFRRDFVISAATASGGLMIGLTIPSAAAEFAKQSWRHATAPMRARSMPGW